jgi:hypothetical protein
MSLIFSPMPGLATMVVVPVSLVCDGHSDSLLAAGKAYKDSQLVVPRHTGMGCQT